MYPDPIPPYVYSVDEVIELLCQEGCQAVRGYIKQLQTSTPIELLADLSEQERLTVLRELQAIMSVYDRCPTEPPADHPKDI